MSDREASHVACGGLEEVLALTRSRLFVSFKNMKHAPGETRVGYTSGGK